MYMKHLYRSSNNRVWKGILGGIGEYAEVDPVVIRAIFIVLLVLTGFFPGILIYILSLLVIPEPVREVVALETRDHG